MSILKELVGFLKFTGEILYEVFDHPCGSPQPQFGNGYSYDKKSNEQETYEYWMNLDSESQRYYFDNNMTLQKYGEMYRSDDRETQAKMVAYISKCTGYSFTDIYDRY